MKKFLLSFLILLSFILISQQPNPLILDKDTKVQPIIDNEGTPNQFLHTVKIYYKDLDYCSDSTKISFIALDGDSISKYNVRQSPSCIIVARFNLTDSELEWLKENKISSIGIYNRVTDNYYIKQVKEPDYFIKVLKPFNK